MAIKKMQTDSAKKTVKKVDDKPSFKAGLKATPETLKKIDDAIEKRYPNYTGPTSFYAGLKSGAKTLLGYKKGGVTKEHPLTAFRKANEARNAVVKKSITKYQSTGEVNESSKPVRKYVKPTTVVRPTTVKPTTVAIPVRTSNKPVRAYAEPTVVTDNPMAGFKVNKPRPVGKYENAVMRNDEPSIPQKTKAVASTNTKPSPATSGKINADKIKLSRLESNKIKSKAIASTKPVKPKAGIAKKILIGAAGAGIGSMFRKKGGAVKTKK